MPAPVPPTSMSGLPILTFQVAFTGTKAGVTVPCNPNDPSITPNWTNLSDRLLAFHIKRGKQNELNESQAGNNTFTLRNIDGALDPENTASPYYPNVLPFRQYRILLTAGGTTYTISTGFMDDWGQEWELHGTKGITDGQATDAFGLLSMMTLESCLASEMLIDNPIGYWPMSEPSSTPLAQNLAATVAAPMVAGNIGSGGGSITFGSTILTNLVGAGSSNGETGPVQGNTTGVTFTQPSSGNGQRLGAPLNTTYSTSALTYELWIQGYNSTSAFPTIIATAGVTLFIDNSGYPQIIYNNNSGGGTQTSQTTSHKVNDSGLHHLAVVTNAGAGTVSLYVDGMVVYTGSDMWTATIVLSGAAIMNGWSAGYTMTVAHVAFYASALSAARISAHYNAGVNAFPESSSARFNRLLSYGPWTGASTVPAGSSNVLGLTDCAAKSLLQALLDLVKDEQGNTYVSSSGSVVFEPRNNRATQFAPVFYFTDQYTGAANQLTYDESPKVDRDSSNIYNAVVVQRPGGAAYRYLDAASILANFPRGFPDNPTILHLDTDQNTAYAAQFMVSRYKGSYSRVSNLTITPSANPALYPLVASLDIGQRVQFVRTPRDATGGIVTDYFIEQVEHDWDASTGKYQCILELSPAAWSRYELVTAARAPLNAFTIAGATSFVVNVPTDTGGNTPAQNGWTATAITQIGISDGANSEVLSVSSMTYAGQLVTITTTAGAAHAHGSGVIVFEDVGVPGYAYSAYDGGAVLDGTRAVGY